MNARDPPINARDPRNGSAPSVSLTSLPTEQEGGGPWRIGSRSLNLVSPLLLRVRSGSIAQTVNRWLNFDAREDGFARDPAAGHFLH